MIMQQDTDPTVTCPTSVHDNNRTTRQENAEPRIQSPYHGSRIKISLVVPCFNESQNIPAFHQSVSGILGSLGHDYEIIFINDGSTDSTLGELVSLSRADQHIKILDLSRNFGKEAALTAGLHFATGDVVIPMDADMQHPPSVIPILLERWLEGYEVVVARRTSRNTDHPMQRWAVRLFYRLHNVLSDTPIPEDVGDFRLMDRSVVAALCSVNETRRFMKGIFSWIGFKTATVDFDVAPRLAGKSSFNGWKLWNLALEGITSFSTVPLRFWSYLGGIISIIALAYSTWIIIKTVLYGSDLPGYPSLFSAILLLGGVQLIGIGVLGEYIGRIYTEVKHRPIYIIRKRYGFPDG